MAVDTAAKRFSMMNLSDGVAVPFLPDGTVEAGDRAHLLELYSGALSGGGAPDTGRSSILQLGGGA